MHSAPPDGSRLEMMLLLEVCMASTSLALLLLRPSAGCRLGMTLDSLWMRHPVRENRSGSTAAIFVLSGTSGCPTREGTGRRSVGLGPSVGVFWACSLLLLLARARSDVDPMASGDIGSPVPWHQALIPDSDAPPEGGGAVPGCGRNRPRRARRSPAQWAPRTRLITESPSL